MFHHYLNLPECIKQDEQIKARVNKRLMKEEEEEEEEEPASHNYYYRNV